MYNNEKVSYSGVHIQYATRKFSELLFLSQIIYITNIEVSCVTRTFGTLFVVL